MAEIVNLRRVKKQRARAEAAQHAAENRVRFGRTREARHEQDAENAKQRAALDGHRREDAPES